MPNAGLLELVAHGVQDAYLIGNPQISFFRKVHKRHTNFVMQSMSGTFEGTQDFGQRLVCKVPRNGDLLHSVLIEIDLPQLTTSSAGASDDDTHGTPKYVENIGEAIINYVDLQIGGQRIDRQYGEWMHIWNQLTQSNAKKTAYERMVRSSSTNGPMTIYIPLQFWFCRNIASALPLVALQYHDVELVIQLNPLSKLHKFGETHYYDLTAGGANGTPVGTDSNRFIINNSKGKTFGVDDGFISGAAVKKKVYQSLNGTGIDIDGRGTDENGASFISTAQNLTISTTRVYIKPSYVLNNAKITSMRIFYDFIFLDTYERKWFAQTEHKYIIDELQFQDSSGINKLDSSKKIELNFNLPVKELYWVIQSEENAKHNNVLDFQSTPDSNYEAASDIIKDFTIHYNGIERFEKRSGEYFRLILPYQKHTNVPFTKYIYCYPFSHNPEIYQPMGASNFSKIDTVHFFMNFNTSTMTPNTGNFNMRVYALSYNVLMIKQGMGGKRFAN